MGKWVCKVNRPLTLRFGPTGEYIHILRMPDWVRSLAYFAIGPECRMDPEAIDLFPSRLAEGQSWRLEFSPERTRPLPPLDLSVENGELIVRGSSQYTKQ